MALIRTKTFCASACDGLKSERQVCLARGSHVHGREESSQDLRKTRTSASAQCIPQIGEGRRGVPLPRWVDVPPCGFPSTVTRGSPRRDYGTSGPESQCSVSEPASTR